MEKAIFNAEMRNILKSIIGKTFVSYECEDSDGPNMTYGNFRINTDVEAIDVSNETKVMPFFDAEEDVACFACIKADPGNPYVPDVVTSTRTVPVQGIIRAVSLVNDAINVNNGEYQITFDQALIIRTDDRIFMFSKDIWFSEMIKISDTDDYDNIYPIASVIEDWNNDGEYIVTVNRTREDL